MSGYGLGKQVSGNRFLDSFWKQVSGNRCLEINCLETDVFCPSGNSVNRQNPVNKCLDLVLGNRCLDMVLVNRCLIFWGGNRCQETGV